MTDALNQFLLCFLPLFVAIDALGVLPIFWNMTAELNRDQKSKLINEAVVACLVVCIVFLFAGKLLFDFLGIDENDFRIAGGLILLVIAVTDIVSSKVKSKKEEPNTELGVVPIGIPLMVGPAALTTILILADNYGYTLVLLNIIVNLAIVWILFKKADFVLRIFGEAGSRAFAKVMALFLAAIAVMMIRVGLTEILARF